MLRLTEAVVSRLDAELALPARMAEKVSRWEATRLREAWQQRLAWPWPMLHAIARADERELFLRHADADGEGETRGPRLWREFRFR